MYAITEFYLVNLFSLRAAPTNAFTARTLPCPTPAALKLALLAKLIERDAPGLDADTIAAQAQARLDWLAPLRVGWLPPQTLTISAVTMTIFKEDNGKTPLIRSVGMREYAHFTESFSIALGPIDDATQRAELADALTRLRALGVAESLIQPAAPPTWRDEEPGASEGFTWLTEEAAAGNTGNDGPTEGTAYVLDDLGRTPRFERLSLYRPVEAAYTPRLGEDRRRVIVTLPLRQRREDLSGRTLARIADALQP
jgi:hypothetical protein